ncbi:MAG TPA: S1 RNA-binding domain-containing protein [Candidatus Nanoarchaeia archaeon]|nr:S1 RNA-binding domain-containing protein [Candidatus Nanoarchaeia archaeon]
MVAPPTKQQFPEEDELVLCTITKIQMNSVFVHLDEYGCGGMIHISEVSPGRIRNIREHVKEGKKVVCKVLRVNTERGHIDLSLRRVTQSERRQKSEELKMELKARKIVEMIAVQLKQDKRALEEMIVAAAAKKYKSLHHLFQAIGKGEASAAKLQLPKDVASAVDELVTVRMKPAEVVIKRRFIIQSYGPEGVEDIKAALQKAVQLNSAVRISYEGAGRYKAAMNGPEYKATEKLMQQVTDTILKEMEKKNGSVEVMKE